MPIATIRADLRPKFQLTLPLEIREALAVTPGDLLEFEINDSGVQVRGLRPIPTDQAWFWTPRWQQMEKEADEDRQAGRVTYFDSADAFENWLENN